MKIFSSNIYGFLTFTILVFVNANTASARPQYMVKRQINSCTACHFSPAGGGPRNIFGKAAGQKQLERGLYSGQDLISSDIKALYISSVKDTHSNMNGAGLMSATVSGAIPLIQYSDGQRGDLIATYDFGEFGTGSREIYMHWQTTSIKGIKPKNIIVGKLNIPFGLLTDEHRTYVRMQSYSSLNQFEFGGMFSGDPTAKSHYDLAIVQGFQKSGASPKNGLNWGIVPNIRTYLGDLPIYIGASWLYFKSGTSKSPWAASLYSAAAITQNFSIISEVVLTQHFNDNNVIGNFLPRFVSPTTNQSYYNDIVDKKSVGALVRFDYDVDQRLTLFYKADVLAPDKRHLKDYYIMNGIGFRYWFNSNMDIDVRYEKAIVRRQGIKQSGVYASKDRVLSVARIWF